MPVLSTRSKKGKPMLKAILYAAALVISIMLLGSLAFIAILPIAFVLLLISDSKKKKEKDHGL